MLAKSHGSNFSAAIQHHPKHYHKIMHPFRGFLKWWYPQIIHFNRVFHYKPSILGYPYFWKHPFCVTTKVLMCSVIRHSVSAFWRPSWYMCLKWNAGESSKVPFVTFCWLQELTWHATYATHVWGVSKNRAKTPKWMVKIMELPIKMGWFGGF